MTAVTGAGESMFPMLTGRFPYKQSPPGERLVIHSFGTSGSALHRKLGAHECAGRPGHPTPQLGVSQHSLQRACPRVRLERWDEQSCFARVDQLRSEEHTSELQSLAYLVCRLLLEKKKDDSACSIISPAPPTDPSPSPSRRSRCVSSSRT